MIDKAAAAVGAVLDPAIAPVRREFGKLLRGRVGGPDAASVRERIWGQPGPRWFAPGDPIWRVHGDASMFSGGIAALLLQSLHPGAMAGVAGHSGYRSDPWGRLQRTSHYLAATTYGTIDTAAEAIAIVRSAHARIRGRDDRGVPYRADDPALLRWVHVAEVWSFLAAHQRYGARPLGDAEADRYVAQTAVPAGRLGATELPTDAAGLDAALNSFRPVLRASPAALDAARFLLAEPPLPLPARPGYGMLAAGAISLLPTWARQNLGLTRPLAADAVGRVATAVMRWGLSGLPDEAASSRPVG